jgi:hypothetical protein
MALPIRKAYLTQHSTSLRVYLIITLALGFYRLAQLARWAK